MRFTNTAIPPELEEGSVDSEHKVLPPISDYRHT